MNWGDGITSTGNFVWEGTYWEVQGSHVYAEVGDYTVHVTVNDGAQSVPVTDSAIVAEVPLIDGSAVAVFLRIRAFPPDRCRLRHSWIPAIRPTPSRATIPRSSPGATVVPTRCGFPELRVRRWRRVVRSR